jgi:hypothetical protein
MILAALTQGGPAATPEPELIKDIVPPVPVPLPPWAIATAVVLALLVIVAGALLIRHWMRNRPAPPAPTPRATALRELERLRGQLASLDPYAFSVAVSDVLRTYIGAQFGLHAPQQTSPEFLAAIAESPRFSDSDRKLLADFLERCDLIKFARIATDSRESGRLLQSAMDFVKGGAW